MTRYPVFLLALLISLGACQSDSTWRQKSVPPPPAQPLRPGVPFDGRTVSLQPGEAGLWLDLGRLATATARVRAGLVGQPSDKRLERQGFEKVLAVPPTEPRSITITPEIDGSDTGFLGAVAAGAFNLFSNIVTTGGFPYFVEGETVYVVDEKGGALWLRRQEDRGTAWAPDSPLGPEEVFDDEMDLEQLATAHGWLGDETVVQRHRLIPHPRGDRELVIPLPFTTILAPAFADLARDARGPQLAQHGSQVLVRNLRPGPVSVSLGTLLEAFRVKYHVYEMSLGPNFPDLTLEASARPQPVRLTQP